MKELMLKKCKSCGAIVKVFEECHCPCDIMCCDDVMENIKPNTVEASLEKHIPSYEIIGDKIKVKVNHVMEEEHYISWIMFVSENKEEIVYFKPGESPEATFDYQKGTLYSYCNKHELWSKNVL